MSPCRARLFLFRLMAALTVVLLCISCDVPPRNPYEHPGPFAQLALGHSHTCLTTTSGQARCWKYGRVPEAPPPTGRFLQISSAEYRACGVLDDHTIRCWGDCSKGRCDVPVGNYSTVSVSDTQICALDLKGFAHCWGQRVASVPTAPFTQLSVGRDVACAVAADRSIACWGNLLIYHPMCGGGAYPVSMTPPASLQGHVAQVATGTSHACAVTEVGSVQCWGDNGDGQSTPPANTDFQGVAVAHSRSCGLTIRGEIECWGKPISWYHKTYLPPPGPFVEIGLGDNHGCARRLTGSVVCWGVDQQSQVSGKRWMLIRN
jgi:alpha-tubulin suppressor-like RCC1 family protein